MLHLFEHLDFVLNHAFFIYTYELISCFPVTPSLLIPVASETNKNNILGYFSIGTSSGTGFRLQSGAAAEAGMEVSRLNKTKYPEIKSFRFGFLIHFFKIR